MHQLILHMPVTKYLDKKLFNYIDPWYETLSSIAWAIRASCYCTNMNTLVQAIYDREMILNLASVVYWQVITAVKKQKGGIDNIQENARRLTNDYIISDQFYVEMTGIYCKLYHKKQ